jgi:hypothetical protein
MSESTASQSGNMADALGALHELTTQLRSAHSLTPETQEALANLLDELTEVKPAAPLGASDAAHLAESARQLTRALKEPRDAGLVAGAVTRLEAAATRIEARAPFVSGIVRRLLAALADLGI